MYSALTTLLDRLDSADTQRAAVIRWGSPVPSFGDLTKSEVATLGLNPSNKEFVDNSGNELSGSERRFHTLKSLGLEAWREADVRHIALILNSCKEYFLRNPYDRWFKKLDVVVAGSGASFYNSHSSACHLDLIPYATECKWTELSSQQKRWLNAIASDSLGLLLRDSPVRLLILNGQSVITAFEEISNIKLESEEQQAWSLPRHNGKDVRGVSYVGAADELGGINLGRTVRILGFNHNIQSSFGVTNCVIQEIYQWIRKESQEVEV